MTQVEKDRLKELYLDGWCCIANEWVSFSYPESQMKQEQDEGLRIIDSIVVD